MVTLKMKTISPLLFIYEEYPTEKHQGMNQTEQTERRKKISTTATTTSTSKPKGPSALTVQIMRIIHQI